MYAIRSYYSSDSYIKNLSETIFYIEGAVKICEELSKKYELAVITNGIAKVQHSRHELTEFGKYFSYLFISEEIGRPKPYKEFFDFVFSEMKITDLSEVRITSYNVCYTKLLRWLLAWAQTLQSLTRIKEGLQSLMHSTEEE